VLLLPILLLSPCVGRYPFEALSQSIKLVSFSVIISLLLTRFHPTLSVSKRTTTPGSLVAV